MYSETQILIKMAIHYDDCDRDTKDGECPICNIALETFEKLEDFHTELE